VSTVTKIQKNLTGVEARKVDPVDIGLLCNDDGASEGEG
jgi:hypothetical protein